MFSKRCLGGRREVLHSNVNKFEFLNQVTRQLFEPLVMQLIHWFTNNKKFESQDTVAVLEAIMVRVYTVKAFRDYASINVTLKNVPLCHLQYMRWCSVEFQVIQFSLCVSDVRKVWLIRWTALSETSVAVVSRSLSNGQSNKLPPSSKRRAPLT